MTNKDKALEHKQVTLSFVEYRNGNKVISLPYPMAFIGENDEFSFYEGIARDQYYCIETTKATKKWWEFWKS